jgi:hypothetical protein
MPQLETRPEACRKEEAFFGTVEVSYALRLDGLRAENRRGKGVCWAR